MSTAKIQNIARQLAQPSGRDGVGIGESMNGINRFITTRCIETLAPAAGQSIIEIGPGNGVLSEPLIDLLGRSGRYHAIEHSADMAALIAERLSARGASEAEVHCGDCDNAPIAAQSADGLLAVNLLYFIADLPAFFTRLHGWLKPGGRAVFGLRSSLALKDMPFTQYGFHVRGLEDIIAAMSAGGFEHINAYYHDEGTVDFDGLAVAMDSLILCGEARGHPE